MNVSALYGKNCSMQTRDAALYLSTYGHMLKWKNFKENILDVGCGEGSTTKQILFPFLGHRVKKLEAIDKLEPMIELAKSTNDRKEINFKTIDISEKEYIANNKNKFDHIFSFYCIQWIVDTRSVLNMFHEILKPDGQIFISAINDAPINRVFNKHFTEKKWSKYFPKKEYVANYTGNPQECIRNALESTGFEVNLCKYEENKYDIIDNYKDFSRSLMYMCDFLDHIPSELREKYMDDYIKDSRDYFFYLEDSDKYKLFYDSIIFIASKKT